MADRNLEAPHSEAGSARSGVEQATSPYDLARQHLIVALDVATANAALALADQLSEQCQWFKVGLELYIAARAVDR